MSFTSPESSLEIDVPIRARSLLVLSGESRHEWLHSIRRNEIKSKRLCITVRELSDTFKKENSEIAKEIYRIANIFI